MERQAETSLVGLLLEYLLKTGFRYFVVRGARWGIRLEFPGAFGVWIPDDFVDGIGLAVEIIEAMVFDPKMVAALQSAIWNGFLEWLEKVPGVGGIGSIRVQAIR